MATSRSAEWPKVKFGEVVRKVNKKVDPETSGLERYIAGEHMDTDNLRITRWGTIGDGYLGPAFTTHFRPGQVLYGSRRTYLRKVVVPDFEGICANTTFVLESSSPELLQEFLPHVMSTESFHAFSISRSKGSVNPYINYSDLVDYEFVLPPVDEQGRIADLLEAVSRASQTTGLALELANQLLCTLAADLTEASGPDVRALTDVAQILDSMRVPLNATERAARVGDVPYYGANGQVGTIDLPIFNEPLTLIPEDGGYFSQWRTEAIAYRIDGPSWVNNHAHVIRAREVPNGWLYFSFRNRDMTKLIVGTTRTKLNKSALERLKIAVPANLNERLEILEQSNSLVQILRRHLNAVDSLKQRVLSDLMDPGEHV